ncbi:ABC transporter permease subunit [Altererythrobacter xixiisoli]|uniref:ABC transporter permease subunit n=1 Tax=Croceibacterium xixiisoli TaxID=1476466 RepID=A0A6I4TWR3_9SPHN|nr:ABC transporter permease [Croceibacterium xixiisoli]MXP00303.1 ABC transporter permease subunit [Croceibacterium xixiisoli]
MKLAPILLRRLIQAVLVALVISTLAFFLMRSLPGDMAFRVAAGRYGPDMVSVAAAEAVRAELGLGRPMLEALGIWLGRLASFDLGVSFVNGGSVAAQLGHELGYTLRLACAAAVAAFIIAVPVGVAAGSRPGGLMDRGSLVVSVILRSVPPFLMGLVLIIVFSLQLQWLPSAGYENRGSDILPALTLGLGLAGPMSRIVREAVFQVRSQPFHLFARTKGLGARAVMLRHTLRNAAVPVVAYSGTQLALLIEGVVVVESLFSWPGIGHALVHAIFARDVPMIQGAILVMSLGYVALNALIDIAVRVIDPRVEEPA